MAVDNCPQKESFDARLQAQKEAQEKFERQVEVDMQRIEKQMTDGMTRLETRMGALERKQEDSAIEVARQFAETSKQMIIMETRIKDVGEKVDSTSAQNFVLLQSMQEQLAANNEWLRTTVDRDKQVDNDLVQQGVESQRQQVKHFQDLSITMLAKLGAAGAAIAAAIAAAWQYFTK
ncbi:hypothetical protein DFP93_101313 [Aneurinibacillus soli]|uniref:Uncharacterized protein n=1 Tax=Aneurinibacillus soli TaxID=1500254 RepID=A0A0U5BBF2_9BACL|nr:hypothetical protein [Aneurinibacillus soli]PYE64287.1 hypothetical protein DFP93_101313 [Aneurinibacillus soli]BAU28236.1 hypothetical protein CB4_02410 [Aneurinibacillus soli]